MDELFFEIPTPLYAGVLGLHRRAEASALAGHAAAVRKTLPDPDEVRPSRRSRRDPAVMLFYGGTAPRWMCSVTRVAERNGFLITDYPTNAITAGETIWTRSK